MNKYDIECEWTSDGPIVRIVSDDENVLNDTDAMDAVADAIADEFGDDAETDGEGYDYQPDGSSTGWEWRVSVPPTAENLELMLDAMGLRKSGERDWRCHVSFVAIYGDAKAGEYCEVNVNVLEFDTPIGPAWRISTSDDAGGSDEAPDTVYTTEADACQAADDYAEEYDESDDVAKSVAEAERDEKETLASLVDPSGEWTVVDMDGRELARCASEESAHAWIDAEAAVRNRALRGRQGMANCYWPRSVIDSRRPRRRADQHSTTWVND